MDFLIFFTSLQVISQKDRGPWDCPHFKSSIVKIILSYLMINSCLKCKSWPTSNFTLLHNRNMKIGWKQVKICFSFCSFFSHRRFWKSLCKSEDTAESSFFLINYLFNYLRVFCMMLFNFMVLYFLKYGKDPVIILHICLHWGCWGQHQSFFSPIDKKY